MGRFHEGMSFAHFVGFIFLFPLFSSGFLRRCVIPGRAVIPQPNYLRQIKDVTMRPPRIRKDHWTPLAVVVGFKNKSTPMSVSNLIQDYIAKHPRPPFPTTMSKRERKVEEQKQIEPTLTALGWAMNEAMRRQYESCENIIKIFWERESLKDIPKLKADIDWPSNIEHSRLVLERGRFVKNFELKREVPSELQKEKENKRLEAIAKKRRISYYVEKARKERIAHGEDVSKLSRSRGSVYVPYKPFVNPTPLENVEVPVTKDTSYGNLVLAFGILLTIALVFAFGFWYYRRRQRRHNFHRLKTNLGTTPRNSVVSTGSAFTVATSSRALENNDFLDTDIMSQVDRTSFVGVESLTPTSSGAGVGTPTITVDSGSARQVSEQRTSELDELRDDTQLS
ncbi:7769_t:CDS:2 [Paraglomus occultum]|uniref:7769_t:CDS:1 n=1 Tax=Paraglomus occultum TaxID=144539 RepID=A0A9N8W9H6_9GLOM|nr:7769_t:CDS:2 [Paraglomus occultum]